MFRGTTPLRLSGKDMVIGPSGLATGAISEFAESTESFTEDIKSSRELLASDERFARPLALTNATIRG